MVQGRKIFWRINKFIPSAGGLVFFEKGIDIGEG
jgi:hypothetical protein